MTLTEERPVVREMVVIHNTFRLLLSRAPALIRGVRDGDKEGAGVVVDHLMLGLDALHHHHVTEDHLLWPKLLDRVQPHRDLVQRMEDQHGGLAVLIEQAHSEAAAFAQTGSKVDGDRLADTAQRAYEAMAEHLADEEEHILPICEEHLSVAEWGELGKEGAAGLDGRRRAVLLGYIHDANTPEDVRLITERMPTLVRRVLWPLVLRRQYDGHTKRLAAAAPGA